MTSPPTARALPSPTPWLVSLCALCLVLCVLHVWIVDDAFITLRQVQQLVLGNGFVWNVGERVQAYTHPLWALLMVPAFALTGEGFWTLSVLSLLVTVAGVGIALRGLDGGDRSWRGVVFLALLLPSKAFFDFTSSGLENCLTHLLVAATWAHLWNWHRRPDGTTAARRQLQLTLLVSATYLNRADTLLLVGPALLVGWRLAWPALGFRTLRWTALGALPIVLWTAWSVLYYGSAIPNTAIAKITGARLSAGERLDAGLWYAFESLEQDPFTLPLAAVAVVLLLVRRTAPSLAAAASIVLYLGYVTLLGAAGTHMSGRFYSAVAWLAAFALARSLGRPTRPTALGTLAVAALVSLLAPGAPLQILWQPRREPGSAYHGIIDTRAFVNREGASLLSWRPGVRMPDHPWFQAGLAFAQRPERVHVGGCAEVGGTDAVGYSAFAAGPDKHIIDYLGLADPLLARLPLHRELPFTRPGHVPRALPAGYVESIETGANRIEDPDLHAYYERLRLVVRGPLWSWDRLCTIAGFAVGAHDALLARYAERAGLRRP